MIPKTKLKLREAKFFLSNMEEAAQPKLVQREPEAFLFYHNAFLTAARAVTWALQFEKKNDYDSWFLGWLGGRRKEDREFLDLMREQRNLAEKQGSPKFTETREWIPITEVRRDDRGHPTYGSQWFGPPGPPPQMSHPVYQLEQLSGEEVISACKRYFVLLDEAVEDFIRTFSPPAQT